ncbi:MAG: transketolase [Oscillospiraceae bacterium]|jgi:transketolase|nr:transketolase [Oscillospiraceae bacterium]
MDELERICIQVRKDIMLQIGTFGVGHVGGSLSIVELLVVLYRLHMRFDPQKPEMSGRDRLIVSKGHSGPAVYAILCNEGFFSRDWLLTLNQPDTNLPSHCDMNKTPGIDMTTGSLGQGFSCAVGVALASRLCSDGAYIYVILGDGELQEGQIWESAMFAAHEFLNNLIVFIDYNDAQIDGRIGQVCGIEPLAEKWRAFGWEVVEIGDGNSCREVNDGITFAKNTKRPCAVILHTIKGKGVSFVENSGVLSHSMVISKENMNLAFMELDSRI